MKPWLALAALVAIVCSLSAIVDAGYGNELAFTLNMLWPPAAVLAIGVHAA